MNPAFNVNSSLTEEQIVKNFEGIDAFSGIMAGLEEAMAYEKGQAKAATLARKSSLPDVDARLVRKSMQMTQKEFARILGVSVRTVEAWETGRSVPTPTARKLMFLISRNPGLVEQLQKA